MKISITNGLMMTALSKGGLAALSPEAKDKDQLLAQPSLNCVKISADDKEFVVESSIQQISSRFSMPIDSTIKVDSPGSLCVDADWLLNNCCRNEASELVMTIEDVPLEQVEEPVDGQISTSRMVHVKFVGKSKDRNQEEAYAPEIFPETSYESGKMVISGKAKMVKEMVSSVIFSMKGDDYLEILDSVAIIAMGKQTVFATCDGKRSTIKIASEGQITNGGKDSTTLVKGEKLNKSVSEFDDGEDISILEDKDGQNVILKSGNLVYKIAMAPSNMRKKFPNMINVQNMETDFSFSVPKDDLQRALNKMYSINQETAKFTFEKGSTEILMASNHEIKTLRKSEASVNATEAIPKSLPKGYIYLSPMFMQDMLKRISGDKVKMSFTADEKKLKMEDEGDPSHMAVIMRMLDQ